MKVVFVDFVNVIVAKQDLRQALIGLVHYRWACVCNVSQDGLKLSTLVPNFLLNLLNVLNDLSIRFADIFPHFFKHLSLLAVVFLGLFVRI